MRGRMRGQFWREMIKLTMRRRKFQEIRLVSSADAQVAARNGWLDLNTRQMPANINMVNNFLSGKIFWPDLCYAISPSSWCNINLLRPRQRDTKWICWYLLGIMRNDLARSTDTGEAGLLRFLGTGKIFPTSEWRESHKIDSETFCHIWAQVCKTCFVNSSHKLVDGWWLLCFGAVSVPQQCVK